MPDEPAFTAIDWGVLAAYLLAVLGIGAAVARRSPRGDEFFLAGRGMPVWAVALSVVATALSAATFIGGPEQAFRGDLTYFSANLGGLVAAVVIALVFLPAFYRLQVTSVYELLGHAYGPRAQRAGSLMFMLGRVFASGARLFMVALPVALVVFGDLSPPAMITSILAVAAVATVYTMAGGIRAVIWTDVLQALTVTGTVAFALCLLWSRIPADGAEIIAALRDDPGGDKLKMLDLGLEPAKPYTLWTALIGLALFNLAAFGTDQDLTQRMLTCRGPRQAAASAILSQIVAWPIVLLFLLLGVLLHVYYRRPDVMGAAAPEVVFEDTRKVFLHFILTELPAGVRGLMLAGLAAAAMSSMDSALNALASTVIADFYRPWRRRREPAYAPDARETRAARIAIIVWAVLLSGGAVGCVYWQAHSGQTLIDFALSVMVFAYAGLLGVFLCALLTRRGTQASAIAAFAVGIVVVLLLEPWCWSVWAPRIGLDFELAFPWRMLVATAVSFTVSAVPAGRRGGRASP